MRLGIFVVSRRGSNYKLFRLELNNLKEEQQHAIKADETKTPEALYSSCRFIPNSITGNGGCAISQWGQLHRLSTLRQTPR